MLVKSAVLNCGKFGHRRMNGCGAGVGIPVAFPGTVIVTTVYHAMKKKRTGSNNKIMSRSRKKISNKIYNDNKCNE